MILSKARVSTSSRGSRPRTGQSNNARVAATPDLDHFLQLRDYVGAIALLRFQWLDQQEKREVHTDTLAWLAYCYFHHGEHDEALDLYNRLLEAENYNPLYHIYSSACLFYMGSYPEAEEAALKGPECPLQIRILFHIAQRKKDEKRLMKYHDKLGESVEDQLSLASIHYLRGHYQEAIDIYKKQLLQDKEWLALNVYIALCYYNMDYHDVSRGILNNYLEVHQDSALGRNLNACNDFKLHNEKAVDALMKGIETNTGGDTNENDLIRHNKVVFRNGEGALQVFPNLVNVLPEANLNLVMHYLRHGEARQAYEMIKILEPTTPQEYIIKAVTYATRGQELDRDDILKEAQQLFHLVGTSASECDTILGRQCMASCFFLMKQFDDALIYLQSIKAYCEDQEDFLWNYAIVKASIHEEQEAEEILLRICSDDYRNDYLYKAWLSHCFISNRKACLAWEQYLLVQGAHESFSLLLLIANECYKSEQFLFAAKAFCALERMVESSDYWEGKRGACIGAFKNIILGKESKQNLNEVMRILKSGNHPQAEHILHTMQKWAEEKYTSPF